mmetsp:Transcript_11583/g.13195  ORF Transcript_11583/g.13195 Transcript_11583/m.13195 type:complete len:94 (-) Transcript_11583:666-947(-)
MPTCSCFREQVEVQVQKSDGYTSNHLAYLCKSNDDRIEPFWFNLDSHQKIVSVHDRVNRIIHHCKYGTTRRMHHIRRPTVKEYCNMMIPMQKY